MTSPHSPSLAPSCLSLSAQVLVLDYVALGSLSDLLARGLFLPPDRRLRIAHESAAALAYLHAAAGPLLGVAHGRFTGNKVLSEILVYVIM
jgi:serine/threonine protein kinase